MANRNDRSGPPPVGTITVPRVTGDPSSRNRIGDALIEEGQITAEERDRALAYQQQHGGRFGDALFALQIIDEDVWVAALSKRTGCPPANFGPTGFDPTSESVQEAARLLDEEFCRQRRCLAFAVSGGKICIAMADPSDVETQDLIHSTTNYRPEAFVVGPTSLREAIAKAYAKAAADSDGREIASILDPDDVLEVEDVEDTAGTANAGELEREAKDAPIVRLLKMVIATAMREGASDIHIEYVPGAGATGKCRCRFRVDGVTRVFQELPQRVLRPLVSLIKISAKLNITERRRPQDGRMRRRIGTTDVEFRVSTMPVADGEETVVLRILSSTNLEPDLGKLGLLPGQRAIFTHAIAEPNGIVLVTGPTGSGKTTTLYSALATLNTTERVVLTAEDPVEYRLPGVRQTQVNAEIDLTFAAALRSFLRQDPDVILVGEIRDYETAEIALKAAMTGHLVLATLHTNSAVESVARLADMGAERYLIAAALRCATAQRLIRTTCTACASPLPPDAEDFVKTQLLKRNIPSKYLDRATLKRGHGCDACGKSGYRGRVAIHEVIDFSDEDLREAIVQNNDSTTALRALAIQKRMYTLWHVGVRQVLRGATTLEEVLRVVRQEDRKATDAHAPNDDLAT